MNRIAYEMKKYFSSKPVVCSLRQPDDVAEQVPDQPIPHDIKPGDYVLIKAKARTKGGHQRWGQPLFEGPFQVTLIHNHTLKVFGRPGWIPIRHVKISPPPFTDSDNLT